MSRLDVLFVIPGNLSQVYQALAKEHATEPPAKARFVASYLLRRDVSVDLIDATVEGFTPDVMAEKVWDANPHLVVLPVYGYNPSSSTQTMPAARALSEAIKARNPEVPILMTGTHPAALPAMTLATEPSVDFVCNGEGPVTVYELLQTLKGGSRTEDIRKVHSLWYREHGWFGHGPAAPNLNLDLEPVTAEAWALMPPTDYHAHLWHGFYADYEELAPYANPFSSEGCPHACTFCNIQAPLRAGESLQKNPEVRTQRRLSPKLFIQEVRFLVEKYGVRLFKVPDEMFGLNPTHVLEICKGLKEVNRECGHALNLWCYFRIDSCRPEFLVYLREAGFQHLGIGIETADGGLRDGMDKGFSNDSVDKVVERIHKAGIETGLNYILGCPGETVETMTRTREMAEALNSAFANFYPYMALPGSPAHQMAAALGYPLPERQGGPGWEGYAYYGKKCEPFYMGTRKVGGEERFYFSEALTPAQIIAFRDWAHVAYYTRPEYQVKLANDPKFGEVALRNIAEWVQSIKSLKRDLLGGRSFHELADEEKARLVPMSARQKDLFVH